MSSSSYLGLKVRVAMTSGEVIEGVITDIDTATGSLRIGQQAIARANICDLQIVTAGADPGASLSVPASSRAQVSFADPAIVSSSRSLADGVVSPPAPPSVSSTSLLSSSSSSLSAAALAPPFATARDAPLTSSAASSPKPTGRRAKAKGVVTRGGSNNPDSNSRNTEGKQGHGWDELTHSMQRHAQLSNKMEKSGRKGGGAGAQRYSNNHSSFYNGDNEQGDQESDLDEDFDFDAALGKFDKEFGSDRP
ncbi:hypothetical protein FA10DRAFT_117988 [Acaromyces ingoldii]|uniref:DFDF domain-containing protein n=1 Tax=Acaromyces ingoldii TaxID=215250 RepID=A0A316YMK2_9BASI|nr:hypothetical protein FA10DRAFT_117988 [Acaromyces ingoldii]PWN90597.1 hypothetical protein FA10DRAFT_117988 [Acaromyces ingoldii]